MKKAGIAARICRLALGAGLLLSAFSLVGYAQRDEASHAQQGQSVVSRPEAGAAEGKTAGAGEKKEPEQDQTASLRHSPSVRWIAEHTGLSIDAAYWVSVGINFLILAGLIGWGLKSNLPKMFRARTDLIRKGIEEAARASQEANARLAEIEARLARLDSEIDEMRRHAEAVGAQEEERIRAAGEEEKRSILASAEQEINSAANQIRRQLKQYAAGLAVSIAEKNISINAATDRELVSEFAGRLGKDGQN